MVSDNLLIHVGKQTDTGNVFELFLSLYRSVAESGLSEVARRVCWHEASRYNEWHQQQDPLARSIVDAIGENPNPWLEEFSSTQKRVLLTLEHAGEAIARAANAQEQAVLCIVTALRQLDPILDKILSFSIGALSYPSPPRADSYTLVRKPRTSFYSLYRTREDLPAPPPLQHGEFDQALGLISTYVVPPLSGGQYFEWDVHRIPESIESVWRLHSQTEISFLLLSFPHGETQMRIDVQESSFRVANLGPKETEIQELVAEQVAKGIAKGASIVLFPELTASDAMTRHVKRLLAEQPNRIGMLVPGSKHLEVSPGVWRNRCTAIDGMGQDTGILHDKFTRYALPDGTIHGLGGDLGTEILEGIQVTPRRVNFYDSYTLGRLAILICRDIIEPQTAEFLRRHFLDHILVISMSPSLKDFQTACSQLGRVLDCGVYVVNTAFGDKPEPAFFYLPIRRKSPLEACPKQSHEVCSHSMSIRLSRGDL